MCTAKKPQIEPMPSPPPPQTVITEDTAAIDARARERRRAGAMSGRRSTILAGDAAPASTTGQAKTVLGA